MKFKEWFPGVHHLYLGLILILIAFFILATGHNTIAIILFLCGLIAVIDDFYQHFRQNSQPSYHSPLHRLYGKIYKYKIIQWLNRLADKLFGARKDGKGK